MAAMNPSVQQYLSKMERPIPGQSLSEDPDSPAPYVSAPEFTVPKEAMEYIWSSLIKEDAYTDVMTSVAQGAAVMEVTQIVLFSGFTEGKWNPDLMFMLLEPTAYMIMALAERAGIDYIIEQGDESEVAEDEAPTLNLEDAPEEVKELAGTLDEKKLPSLMAPPAPEVIEPQSSLIGKK